MSSMTDSLEKSDASATAVLPVLGIDCDDVLGHYLRSVIDWHNSEYKTEIKLDDVSNWDLQVIFKDDALSTTVEKVNCFSRSQQYRDIQPIDGAKEALHTLKHKYNLILITARHPSTEQVTKEWIHQHFGEDVFSEYYFTRDKAAVCKAKSVFAIIDDSIKNVETCCHHVQSKAFLFNLNNSYPWIVNYEKSKGSEKHSKIEVIGTWLDVLERLK